jgi:hypothetical protein
MAHWQQIEPPDGYDSPSFEMSGFVTAPRCDENGATWHFLKRGDAGELSEVSGSGVWQQARSPSQLSYSELQQVLGWAAGEMVMAK